MKTSLPFHSSKPRSPWGLAFQYTVFILGDFHTGRQCSLVKSTPHSPLRPRCHVPFPTWCSLLTAHRVQSGMSIFAWATIAATSLQKTGSPYPGPSVSNASQLGVWGHGPLTHLCWSFDGLHPLQVPFGRPEPP